MKNPKEIIVEVIERGQSCNELNAAKPLLMLGDIAAPEKEVLARSTDELRDSLETSFKTTYFHTSLDHMRFLPSGQIQFNDQEMPCAPGFLDAAAIAIRMPLDYAYRLDFGLFQQNFECRKAHCSRAVTICCNRGIAVNLADPDYRPAHTADVLRGLVGASFWTLNGARVSDRGVDINLIQPGCTVTPEPGDVIQFGVRLSNSETGYTGLKASLFSLRLVCANGAVMADQLGTVRWNYDRRVAYTTSIEKFLNDLFKLRGRQEVQAQLYDELLQLNLLDREFVNVWRRMRTTLPSATAVDAVLDVRVVGTAGDPRGGERTGRGYAGRADTLPRVGHSQSHH